LRPPACWRLETREGREVGSRQAKIFSGEALRRPASKANFPSRAADPQEFTCRLFLVGCKHDAKGGEHNIKSRLRKRQVFCVTDLKSNLQALRRGPFSAPFQEGWHVVKARHVSATTCRCQRSITTAGGHIEDLVTGSDVDSFTE